MRQMSLSSQGRVPFAELAAPLGPIAEGVIAAAELALGAGAAMVRRLHSAWLRRRTVRILTGLDDHLLRDIGVRRGDILRVAAVCVSGRTASPRRMG
jgi:uncharacterized protein YjiS (DUF1127 family)